MNHNPGLIRTYSGDTLSLAQNAYLFSLSARGSAVSCIGIRREACVLAALCREMKPGFIGLEDLLADLLFGTIPSPALTRLNHSLGESVCLLGLTGRRRSKNQLFFPPCRPAVEQLAAQLKHLLLTNAPLVPQLWILCYLLDATGLWNRFFSRRELTLARRRLPKMEHTLAGRILGTIDRMDSLLTLENFCAC